MGQWLSLPHSIHRTSKCLYFNIYIYIYVNFLKWPVSFLCSWMGEVLSPLLELFLVPTQQKGLIASYPLGCVRSQTSFQTIWFQGADIGMKRGLGTGAEAPWPWVLLKGVRLAHVRSVTLWEASLPGLKSFLGLKGTDMLMMCSKDSVTSLMKEKALEFWIDK